MKPQILTLDRGVEGQGRVEVGDLPPRFEQKNYEDCENP